MVQTLKREKTMRERVFTIEPTVRVERLRQTYLDTPDKVVIDILRIRTRVMQETEGESREIRQAKAFAEIVREMPINIYPDEGQSLNMRLSPEIFEKDDGFKRLADFIRVFVDERVDHVQINVVSSSTLRAAQKEPEKYKDLTVKVAGYNARFVTLHKKLQDSIIARIEHSL